MRDLATQHGIRTAVGLQNRYSPAVAFVRDLLAQGYVGKLYSVTLSRSNDQTAQMAISSAYLEFLEAANAGLRILAGHALDTVAAYVGEFVDLQAYVESEMTEIMVADTGELAPCTNKDHILVQGRLAEGAVVSVVVKKNSPTHKEFHLEISGSCGTIVVTEGNSDSADRQAGVPHDLVIHGTSGFGAPCERLTVPTAYRTAPPNTPDDQALCVAMLYQRFAASVLAEEAFDVDFSHGVMRHRLLEIIQCAADNGSRISFGA